MNYIIGVVVAFVDACDRKIGEKERTLINSIIFRYFIPSIFGVHWLKYAGDMILLRGQVYHINIRYLITCLLLTNLSKFFRPSFRYSMYYRYIDIYICVYVCCSAITYRIYNDFTQNMINSIANNKRA